jgi:hypothetical protein
VLVRDLAVPVRVLAVVVGRGGVFFRLIMVAVIVMMGCLAVVVCRCLMLCGRIVMMIGGNVLLFLGHGEILLKTKSMTFQGKVPLSPVTNFGDSQEIGRSRLLGVPKNEKADVEHPKAFDHVGLLFNEPPGMAGLPFN